MTLVLAEAVEPIAQILTLFGSPANLVEKRVQLTEGFVIGRRQNFESARTRKRPNNQC